MGRDDWWIGQFRKLLAAEMAGTCPRTLENRWLLLASRTWGDRRWTVSVDVPDTIYHVLDEADVRAKDRRYAEGQWRIASEWLNA